MGKSYGEIFHEMFTMPNVQWPDVWQAILETLYMTVVSTIFAFIFGLILGVLLFLSAKSHSPAARVFYTIVSFIVNLFRAIPFIILILLLIPFTSVILGTISGPTGALPALIIGAAPFYARLVEIAFKEIDKGVIEAAWSMGANTWTVVRKVLLPEAMPALVSGITVTAIALVGSTAIAGVIGAGGLGNLAYLTGFTRNQNDVILVSTVFILIIVFIIQFLGIGLQIKLINAKEKGTTFNEKILGIILVLALTVALAACGGGDKSKTITVGASPAPHAEILEKAKPLLKKKGYDLQIKTINDYTTPNKLLDKGEIDANFFQHTPYLKLKVKKRI